MSFLVSTISSDVLIKDLGLYLSHPTIDRDISLEFNPEDIAHSANLTAAISQPGAVLVAKLSKEEYGIEIIDGYFYNPYILLQENLNPEFKEQIITAKEIKATDINALIYPGVFPIQVSSTTNSTRRIVSNGAAFESWLLDSGDIVVITGSAAAGRYRVDTVIDQKTFSVIEPLASTAGVGTISIYHPVGASITGFNPSGLFSTSALNVQDAIKDLDGYISTLGVGTSSIAHDDYDTLVHNLAENNYEEYTYTGLRISSIISWTDIFKTTKIRESSFTYLGSRVSSEVNIQYDSYGAETQRLLKNYTYTGRFLSNVSITEFGGTTQIEHEYLDTLVHNLAETSYEEYSYTGARVSNITVWNSSSKTTKIREYQYTYSGRKVSQTIEIQYNSLGIEVERLTSSIGYAANQVVNISMVESI